MIRINPIIRLVNRNLTISINPGFIIWQILFPLIYIFVAGFAYTSLIDSVPFGGKNLDYPAFLASGMIDVMVCLNKLCLVRLQELTTY